MGCWSAPYKTKDAVAIRELLMEPLSPFDAEDKLYHLMGDDDLFDSFNEAKEDEDTDVRPTVLYHLQKWFGANGDDYNVRRSWRFKDDFEIGALVVFNDILKNWNQNGQYPVANKEKSE